MSNSFQHDNVTDPLLESFNKWFIKIRYYVILLLGIIFFSSHFLPFETTPIQKIILLFITFFLLGYNIILDYFDDLKLNESQKALLQIIFDLFALYLLIYITGGIEAPIFLIIIFHLIIGSVLIKGNAIYYIAASVVISLGAFSALEYNEIIPHMKVGNLYAYEFYKDYRIITVYFIGFSLVVMGTVILTKKIANELFAKQDELSQAVVAIRDSEKNKQKYIMGIVHELKSPIAAAISQLELLTGGFAGEVDNKALKYLEKAEARNKEAITSINSILKISQFKVLNKIEPAVFAVDELLNNIVEEKKEQAKRKNLNIGVKNNIGSVELYADLELVKLALSNLIANAVKYTPNGGTVEVIVAKHKRVRIIINDTGIGIPQGEEEKIFSGFYRASNAREQKIEGTGTGMQLVKQIVEAHDSVMTVKSPSPIGNREHPGTSVKISFSKNLTADQYQEQV